MAIRLNLYDILGLSANASGGAIRSAFRKAALQHHPDRNDSPEDATRFRIIHNAYVTLCDPTKRREYDAYLSTSSVFAATAGQAAESTAVRPRLRTEGTANTVETVLSHLNYVLWDIEYLLRSRPDWASTFNGISVRGYTLRMLMFIDSWILTPTGYPDYFFEARRIPAPSNTDTLSMGKKLGHGPFVSMNDYFCNIRMRTDKLLKSAKLIDLLETVPETGAPIIDCVFEAHNLCAHYVGYLRKALIGEADSIPDFSHSNPCFDR